METIPVKTAELKQTAVYLSQAPYKHVWQAIKWIEQTIQKAEAEKAKKYTEPSVKETPEWQAEKEKEYEENQKEVNAAVNGVIDAEFEEVEDAESSGT